jgi:ATP-dependent helicase/nuclease subunit B
LFSEADLSTLRLPTVKQRHDTEGLMLAHALSGARVTFLHRTDDGRDPVMRSPWLAQIDAARLQHGLAPLAPAVDHRLQARVEALPASRPLPIAATLLPAKLSASACEDLRTCPYRFFARHMLALREVDELDGGIQKREFGLWLHATLHRFHRSRRSDADPDHDSVLLANAAAKASLEMGLSEADLLPYTASFSSFVPKYLEWQRCRDARGVHWVDGERRWTAVPLAWGGVLMHGIVDRIDREPGQSPPRVHLVDYKTGNVEALRKKVRSPLEDTQLAFYAALCLAQPENADTDPGALAAIYLALDNSKEIVSVAHPDVAISAAALIQGVGGELSRLREGAALPALGEGEACTHCDARGLCRRDQWAASSGPPLDLHAGS